MRNFILFFAILITNFATQANLLKTASLNMEGWADSSDSRSVKLNQIFQSQDLMKDVSFLMVQESIEYKSHSTASQLASAIGWKSFSHSRISDREGLGFLYPPETQIQSIDVYQIQSRESENDYSRMALAAQIKDPTWGYIRYLNCHLAHKPDMGATRKRQITEILTWLKRLEDKNPSQLIIFGGDFNTDVNHSAYAHEFDLLKNSALKFIRSPSEGANYTWSSETGTEKALVDYFFFSLARSPIKVRNPKTQIYTQTIEQGISDHALLIMTLDSNTNL